MLSSFTGLQDMSSLFIIVDHEYRSGKQPFVIALGVMFFIHCCGQLHIIQAYLKHTD